MFSRSILVATASLILIDELLALQVLSPAANAIWSTSSSQTVAWTSVASDPNSFSIVLANNNPNCAPTGSSQVVRPNVSTGQGSIQIGPFPYASPCAGYQINLVAPNGGILAQSPPFELVGTISSTNTTGTAFAPIYNSSGATYTSGNSTFPYGTTYPYGSPYNTARSASDATVIYCLLKTPPATLILSASAVLAFFYGDL